MTRVYCYVPHRLAASYIAAGWIPTPALDGTHHGRHAILMRACACWGGDHAR